MKTTTKILGLLLVASSFLFTGCNDEEDGEGKPVTNTHNVFKEEYTDVKFIFTEAKLSPYVDYDGDGDIDEDIVRDVWSECEKDNIIVFKSDGSYYVNEYQNGCNNNANKNIVEGTWKVWAGEGISTYLELSTGSGKDTMRFGEMLNNPWISLEEQKKVQDLEIKIRWKLTPL